MYVLIYLTLYVCMRPASVFEKCFGRCYCTYQYQCSCTGMDQSNVLVDFDYRNVSFLSIIEGIINFLGEFFSYLLTFTCRLETPNGIFFRQPPVRTSYVGTYSIVLSRTTVYILFKIMNTYIQFRRLFDANAWN